MAETKFDPTDLVELQLIENAISARHSEIKELELNKPLEKAKEELDGAKENFDKASSEYRETDGNRKKLEDKVELQNEKIGSNEEKLFSGTITSSKELENYQEENESLKESNSKYEDEALELMELLEGMDAKVKEAKLAMDEKESEVVRIKNEMDEKLEVLNNIVGGLNNRREEVLSRIPGDLQKKYNEVKSRKGGIAVSVLKNFFCSVCNMEIPAIEAEKIEDPDEIYKCPLCGRISIVYREEIDKIEKELES